MTATGGERTYALRIFQYQNDDGSRTNEVELGSYESVGPPWVPRVGEFLRFRDHRPPGKAVDHAEKAGYVMDVVTVVYGRCTVVEVYIGERV